MATKFAAREVLVLATEDECSGRFNSENREGIDGAIHAYCGNTRLARKAWKTSVPLWEKPFQDQDLVASLPEGSRVAEDELQEEDHLGKQSFVPKAILHW